MATYRIECEPCEIYWEVERPMEKPPKKAKCPQCGKMGNRSWTTPGVIFQGMDFQTNRAQAERFSKEGMDKDTANEWLENSIKASKSNMDKGYEHYKPMYLDPETGLKNGMLKTVDDKTKMERFETAKKNEAELAKRAYKK